MIQSSHRTSAGGWKRSAVRPTRALGCSQERARPRAPSRCSQCTTCNSRHATRNTQHATDCADAPYWPGLASAARAAFPPACVRACATSARADALTRAAGGGGGAAVRGAAQRFRAAKSHSDAREAVGVVARVCAARDQRLGERHEQPEPHLRWWPLLTCGRTKAAQDRARLSDVQQSAEPPAPGGRRVRMTSAHSTGRR